MTDKKKLVDQKCWELAEHFLGSVDGHTTDDIRSLAEDFQMVAEDHCDGIEQTIVNRTSKP